MIQVQRLQLLATKGQWHQLPLIPPLGLGIPLALQDRPVISQKRVRGAVGVVHNLNAAGVGHGLLRITA